jgi:hypothetical protein
MWVWGSKELGRNISCSPWSNLLALTWEEPDRNSPGFLCAGAYACNPSYSGGTDQENWGSKAAWANSLRNPILRKPFTKKCWWTGSRCSPWVQTLVLKETKKPKNKWSSGTGLQTDILTSEIQHSAWK